MTEDAPPLLVSRQDGIATVSFNRPAVRHAFNLAMWQALAETMDALSAEDGLRCVILRGTGTQAFSAGADIGA